jgi:hypothetical protein
MRANFFATDARSILRRTICGVEDYWAWWAATTMRPAMDQQLGLWLVGYRKCLFDSGRMVF